MWRLHEAHGSYPFTGTIASVNYEPGPQPSDAPANMVPVLRELGLKYE